MILREARPEDAMAVADVHVRAWQAAYEGLLPAEFLARLRPEDRAARYTFGLREPRAPRTVLALAGERVLGFATTAPSRDADAPDAGELVALYVDPLGWRGGVGRSLLVDSRARLRAAGHREGLLWVLAGNERAAGFYLADGWRPDGHSRLEDPYGVTSEVFRYRRAL